jgi:phenylacetate-CoA ligase
MQGRVWNEEMELLSREACEGLRIERLKSQLEYCYANSEYYRKKFDEVGATTQDIRTWEDFRRLPILMNKDEERESQQESLERFGHPYGMHLCAPPESIIVAKTTGGTTGAPTFSYSFTPHDLARWNEGLARAYWLAGLRPGHRVLFCFPLCGGWAGSELKTALTYMGTLSLDMGTELEVERIIEFTKWVKPNVLMSTPSFAEALIEQYRDLMGMDVKGLGIEKLLLSGEPGVGVPSIRKKMEGAYGGRWADYMAVCSEAFCGSCLSEEYQGFHEVALDLSIYSDDLVDPETKIPIEVKEGAIGEGVITSLDREGVALIKYSLGDIIQVFTERCPCGYPGPGNRFKVIGRLEDRLLINGQTVYPMVLRDAITSFYPRVTGAMRIVLTEPPPFLMPPLKIRLEYGYGVETHQLDELDRAIREKIFASYQIQCVLEFLPPESLGRVTKKTPLFEKLYEK